MGVDPQQKAGRGSSQRRLVVCLFQGSFLFLPWADLPDSSATALASKFEYEALRALAVGQEGGKRCRGEEQDVLVVEAAVGIMTLLLTGISGA